MGTNITRTIFLNVLLRVYLHRSICLCSFFALILTPFSSYSYDTIPYFRPILGVILGHHIAITFQSIRTKINLYVDLLLLLAEMSVLGYCTAKYTRVYVDRWAAQVDIGLASLIWSLLVFLSLLAAFRVATIIKNKGQRRMGINFDMLTDSKVNDCDGIQQRQTPSAPKILIGQSIWRKVIVGESKNLTRLRGIFAVVLVLAVASFAMVNIIMDPVRETALTPVKELRALGLPWDFENEAPSWNVVVLRVVAGSSESVSDLERLRNAVNVTPLWDKSMSAIDPVPAGPPCRPEDKGRFYGAPYQIITIICPPRTIKPSQSPFLTYRADIMPDLLITVDFTELNVQSDSRVDSAMALNSVQILISLTNDTSLALRGTIATLIPPGVNLIGTVNIEFRQVYEGSAGPAFGLFGGRMLNVLPDPEASFLPNGRNISTLRVSPQVDLSELRIVLDSLESSVLKGFSAVGGLWTFLSGIFTIVFGMSLMRLVYGVKPLSVFGLAHIFQTEKIRRECVEQYPKLLEEDQAPQEERGLLKLIRDHLVELHPLDEDEKKFESRPISQHEINNAQLESGVTTGEADTA